MLIARRNLMAGKPLPYLRRVAWLGFSGTQYINTGRAANLFNRIGIRLMKTEAHGTRRFIIGTDRASSSQVGSSTYFDVNTSGYFGQNSNGIPCNVNEWYNIVADIKKGYSSDGGMTWYKPFAIFVFGSDKNQCFGSIGAQTTGRWVGKIGDVSFYGNSENLKLIPVIDLSGHPCYYDEAQSSVPADDASRFFYNAGSGVFTWGELET